MRITYPRNGSTSAGKLLLNTPKIPRHRNLACNSPTLLSNIETRTLIFRGFLATSRDTLRGIACEIWGGCSAEPAVSTVSTVSTGFTGGCKHSRCPVTRGPQPQRCPKRRPPLLNPLKYSHYGRGGLHFGQIAGEGHRHQHASTADTTSTTACSHADRL